MKRFLLIALLLSGVTVARAQWKTNGPYGGEVNAIVVLDTQVFAATTSGVYVSGKENIHWVPLNPDAPVYGQTLSVCDDKLVLGGDSIYYSSDRGHTWIKAGFELGEYNNVNCSVSKGPVIIMGVSNVGILRSTDCGVNWEIINKGIVQPEMSVVFGVCFSGTTLFTATQQGFYRSEDMGDNWVADTVSSLQAGQWVWSVAADDNNIYAGGGDGKVHVSHDNGATWTASDSALHSYVSELAVVGNSVWAGTWGAGLYLSGDGGATWQDANTGLQGLRIASICVDGPVMYTGMLYNGVSRSTNGGQSWESTNEGLAAMNTNQIVRKGNKLFAGSEAGVYMSADKGASWVRKNNGIPKDMWVRGMAVCGERIFAGLFTGYGDPYSIMVSEDEGDSWRGIFHGLGNGVVVDNMVVEGNNIYATYNSGVLISHDGGLNWTTSNVSVALTALAVSGPNVIAASYSGLYLSTDQGDNWTNVSDSVEGHTFFSISASGDKLYGASLTGVYQSADHGQHWDLLTQDMYYTDKVASQGPVIVVHTEDKGMYLSTDYGTHWMVLNTGLGNRWYMRNENDLVIIDSIIYAGMSARSIWQLPVPVNTDCQALFTLYADTTEPHHWFALDGCGGVEPFSYVWEWGDGSAPSTEATPMHVYSDSGYYNICLTIYDAVGCISRYCDSGTYIRSADAMMISVNVVKELPTGIAGVTNDAAVVKLYPNPAIEVLLVQASGFKPERIAVYDINGRQLNERAFTTRLDISGLAAGVYFAELSGASGVLRKRFVKEE